MPKKETARIQIGSQQKPILPKATVKMQQTQPLAAAPAPSVAKATESVTPASGSEAKASSAAITILSAAALAASAVAAVLAYLAYSALS